jgi:hypothetical protein
MHTFRTTVLATAALAVALSASAQTAAPAKPATPAPAKSAPAAPAVQPALAALAAPRAADLSNAGIQKIVARTGHKRRDIQVMTPYGASYFPWPKGVKPAPFQLDVGAGGALTVRAAGYTEASKPNYASAFDAVLPEAIRLASESRAKATRPRP